jgi:hypothetical protein
MPEITTVPISEVMGWKLNDDKTHALLGLKQPNGHEFVLSITEHDLRETIMSLAHATEAFPAPKGLSIEALAMPANWFEFGKDDRSEDYFLRLRLKAGGHLAFVMNKAMAQQLAETLNVMVLAVTMDLPPGAARN